MRNKYNIFISIITILILSEIASASIIASKEEPLIFVYDGGKINLTSNQSFDKITTTSKSLNISMNGSYLNVTSNTSKNISKISIYNDTATFNANGSNGYLNFTTLLNKSLSVYGIKFDGSLLESKSTDANGQLNYNYTGAWSEHIFSIENVSGAPTPAPTTSAASRYVSSTCASTLNWGIVGASLIGVLVIVIAGILATGFMTTGSKDTSKIIEFALVITSVVVIGSIGVALISSIITAVGCP